MRKMDNTRGAQALAVCDNDDMESPSGFVDSSAIVTDRVPISHSDDMIPITES
jgi:hypothetical protein